MQPMASDRLGDAELGSVAMSRTDTDFCEFEPLQVSQFVITNRNAPLARPKIMQRN
jgi:hypothetical protein